MRTFRDVISLLELRIEQLQLALTWQEDPSTRAWFESTRVKLERYKRRRARIEGLAIETAVGPDQSSAA